MRHVEFRGKIRPVVRDLYFRQLKQNADKEVGGSKTTQCAILEKCKEGGRKRNPNARKWKMMMRNDRKPTPKGNSENCRKQDRSMGQDSMGLITRLRSIRSPANERRNWQKGRPKDRNASSETPAPSITWKKGAPRTLLRNGDEERRDRKHHTEMRTYILDILSDGRSNNKILTWIMHFRHQEKLFTQYSLLCIWPIATKYI